MGNIMVSNSLLVLEKEFWTSSGIVFASIWLCFLIYIIYKCLMEKPWCRNAANYRAIEVTREIRQTRFNEVAKIVEEQNAVLREEILSLSFYDLRDALQEGKYSAKQVLYAYAWKALKIQAELNCICEFLIESFELADSLDEKYKNNDQKPPLYGIPFSVKNNFYMKGYDSTVGLVQLLGKPQDTECTFVTQLKNLGAIPFVSTNVPQTLLSFHCSNPIYGTTLNPHNPNRTPGGSSGGEACLLAAGGTPFAIGSDIGGSVRIPAVFCGLNSLKPTQDRFLVENVAPGLPGRSRLGLSYGFFTKTVAEQSFLSELIWGTSDYKRLILRDAASIPFRKNIYDSVRNRKNLRIGYFVDDGFIKATPGCARVVEETVKRLRAEGHEMVRFHVPEPFVAASCLFRSILCDSGAHFLRLYSQDIVDEYMKVFVTLLKTPKWIRSLMGLVLQPISPQIAAMARAYVVTAEDVRITNAEVDDYCKKFMNLWKDLDAIVCPAFTVPAVAHNQPSKVAACAFATSLYNMLDCPSGIVTVGKVTKQDDANLEDENVWPTGYNLILKMIRTAAKNSAGLPLAVQVVTKPFEEEQCLGVMKIVEDIWKSSMVDEETSA